MYVNLYLYYVYSLIFMHILMNVSRCFGSHRQNLSLFAQTLHGQDALCFTKDELSGIRNYTEFVESGRKEYMRGHAFGHQWQMQ